MINIYRIIQFFTFIQYFFNTILNYFKDKFVSTSNIFSIDNIFIDYNSKLVNNTKLYFLNQNWNNNNVFDSCKFHWSFNKNKYISIFKSSNDLAKFPPYSFEEMKLKPNNKIISALLIHDNNKNHIEDVTRLIKMYAGPKHNFYSDINLHVSTFDIFNSCCKTLQIIKTNKIYSFNLNSNSLLQF